MSNRIDRNEYSSIAEMFGIDASEVKRAVESYFGLILSDARPLPFDNPKKIYSRKVFDGMAKVRGIPSIGRFGPSYTRYLNWRSNASGAYDMVPKSSFRMGYTKEEVERFAESLLSGGNPEPPKKKKGTEMYERVWLVGTEGKKSARQVMPKKK